MLLIYIICTINIGIYWVYGGNILGNILVTFGNIVTFWGNILN
nr:MAG TPA: hypothetical protein [Caudoviricetes sp.]